MKSSTYFDPEGSSSGRLLYIHRYSTISMHVKHYTITVYKTVFLKMNPRFQNM